MVGRDEWVTRVEEKKHAVLANKDEREREGERERDSDLERE